MPALTVSIRPETKVLIDVLSALMQSPPARVIDRVLAAYEDRLTGAEKQAVDALKQAALGRLNNALPPASADNKPVAIYEFSRLCFKRDVIESLAPTDSFRVITPNGVFQMTKSDFYRVFSNVAASRSYLQDGLYHYPKLPSRAEEFRVG